MEPLERDELERDELSNSELDELLPQWKAPVAPARLRSALFGQSPRAWWRTMWSASIRIPVPALLVLAILLGIVVWQRSPGARPEGHELQPVAELRPKIIRTKITRSGNAQN